MSDADFDDQLCAVFSEKNDIRHDCIEPLLQPCMCENIDFGWAYNLGMSSMLGNNLRIPMIARMYSDLMPRSVPI